MGDLGIDSRLAALQTVLIKSVQIKFFVSRVYYTGVCHGPVPVVENKFSLRIYA